LAARKTACHSELDWLRLFDLINRVSFGPWFKSASPATTRSPS
jgi:hypothetical protein